MADFQNIRHPNNNLGRNYPVPKQCPHCNNFMTPDVLHDVASAGFPPYNQIKLLMLCGKCCSKPFFCVHGVKDNEATHLLTYPKNYAISIQAEIENLSPGFAELYRQSHEAEENNALALAACGYLNALQVLVVDYAIQIKGKQEKELRKTNDDGSMGNYIDLRKLINICIDDPDLKAGAHEIRDYGNSATHSPSEFDQENFDYLKEYLQAFLSHLSSHIKLRNLRKPKP